MDPMMVGLAGTIAGASAVGVLGVVRTIIETWFPGVVAKTDHVHELNVNLQSIRHESIKSWRAGLAGARDAHRQWAAGPHDRDPPSVVGDEWYESLRPHLPTTGEVAKFRSAHQVACDDSTLVLLSLEIGRIEDAWIEELRGRRRIQRGAR